MHIVKVSSKGQIVIPKEVRERLRIGRETELVLLEAGEVLVLRKSTAVEAILHDEFGPLLRASEEALRDVWENSVDDVWNEV